MIDKRLAQHVDPLLLLLVAAIVSTGVTTVYSATFAQSSGVGISPIGIWALTRSTPSSPPFISRKRGVSVGPGAMQFARAPCGASVAATERVNAMTPALAAT